MSHLLQSVEINLVLDAYLTRKAASCWPGARVFKYIAADTWILERPSVKPIALGRKSFAAAKSSLIALIAAEETAPLVLECRANELIEGAINCAHPRPCTRCLFAASVDGKLYLVDPTDHPRLVNASSWTEKQICEYAKRRLKAVGL